MRVNNNLMAMNANRALGINTVAQSKSLEKLSSGKRINRAADDAAGLSISEKMRGQIRGLTQASRNAQDGISFLQTAEGAMDEVSAMLVRLKELSVQKANGTYDSDDVANLELEMTQLGLEIDNIITTTVFNGKNINATIDVVLTDDGATTTTIGATIAAQTLESTSTTADIEASITAINTARSTLGAHQNRLESVSRNLDCTVENLQAAESRIRDTDMAKEMMNFTKNNILVQSATAMLAQANQAPQAVLSLLR
jgi:flagellin